MPIESVAIILLGAVGLALWWLWRRGAPGGAETQLRRVCFGDAQQAERLITFEIDRAGGTLSRAEAARRALERHRRDNR